MSKGIIKASILGPVRNILHSPFCNNAQGFIIRFKGGNFGPETPGMIRVNCMAKLVVQDIANYFGGKEKKSIVQVYVPL